MLAHRGETLDRLGARDLDPLDLEIGLRQLAHLRFDLRQILDRERSGRREVIEESVLDRRADRHLRAGVEALHRLGHQMGGRMAQHVEPLGAVGLDRLDRSVILDRAAEIDQLAVEARGDDVAPARAVEHLADRGPARHAATLPVERYGDLRAHSRKNFARVNVATR